MSKKRPDHVTEEPASELVKQFSGCGNYPPETAGVLALARSLERSAMDTGLRMQAIVDECLGSSQWCPAPFELRGVAISMRDKIRNQRAESKHKEWQRIYGAADPDWSSKAVAALMARDGHTDQLRAIHEQAIRDMLYYTEGEGNVLGDREFWEEARRHDLSHHADLVGKIRDAGGWRTERELQNV